MVEKHFKDLHVVAAKPVEAELAGQKLKLYPLTVDDVADVKAQIRARRLQGLDTFHAEQTRLAGPTDQRDRRLSQRAILESFIPDEEVFAWLLYTLEGTIRFLWLSLRHGVGMEDLPLSEVEELVQSASQSPLTQDQLKQLTSLLGDISGVQAKEPEENAEENPQEGQAEGPEATTS